MTGGWHGSRQELVDRRTQLHCSPAHMQSLPMIDLLYKGSEADKTRRNARRIRLPVGQLDSLKLSMTSA
jgi:hypothetical protein